MKEQTNPDWLESWPSEAIGEFADAATGKEVAAMHESFKRQADFCAGMAMRAAPFFGRRWPPVPLAGRSR
jgi:hypothetical protein